MSGRPRDLSADIEATNRATAAGLTGVPRLRTDLWNRLRDAARRLATVDDDAKHAALATACGGFLDRLAVIEPHFAFPGAEVVQWLGTMLDTDIPTFEDALVRIGRGLNTGEYRRLDLGAARMASFMDLLRRDHRGFRAVHASRGGRPYFEVLVVEDGRQEHFATLRTRLRALRTPQDRFTYEVVHAASIEDALIAVLVNPDIQAVVARFGLPLESAHASPRWTSAIYHLLDIEREELRGLLPGQRTSELGMLIDRLRPELDLYRVTDAPVEQVVGAAGHAFRRIFYQVEDHQDLHVSILHGIGERYATPFFDALQRYAERPTGMFHALPLSRGRTVSKSHWIQDFGDFYGNRLFLAETSATTGGLDSLLQPTGSLKDAQTAAARAFGAARTYFVTNGTSTANKIALQALVRPGDVVMLGHDCHKSHPYAVILSGASPIVLDGYALDSLSMYGGVPLALIVKRLLALRDRGQLSRVRVLLLTNLTFDGITYDPYKIMRTVLAIHPGIQFLWDEAWFAYGYCSPLLRQRSAMDAARRLDRDMSTSDYAEKAAAWAAAHPSPSADDLLASLPIPDPTRAKVRVYATHSTHKTLTALRQGSMIQVFDRDFERRVEEPFHEAYMTHTSTSPNYQILASLDVGRRQVELEGYRLVNESLDLAMLLRQRISGDPLLARYFSVLGPEEMVPAEYRASGLTEYVEEDGTTGPIEAAWRSDEFVLDPTRVTLHVGRTGYDGEGFKELLMDEYAIHINKTSRNTVLFLIHIGAARGTLAHLVKVLSDIARKCALWFDHASAEERAHFQGKAHALTEDLPLLPDFSSFHPCFVPPGLEGSGAGDIRRAYFLAYDPELTSHVAVDEELAEAVSGGAVVVAASFVTPYPPGFPILIPGQILSRGILDYLLALDTKEVHGLHAELGLRVFCDAALSVVGATETPYPLPGHEPAPTPKPPKRARHKPRLAAVAPALKETS